MIRVPREIDELMWEVAEIDDLATIDQFGARYPEFRSELVKRLQMVRSLRGSRPNSATPQFVPRQRVRNLGPSKFVMALVAASVLASMTFATYATVQYVQSQDQPVESSGTEYALNPPDTVSDATERSTKPAKALVNDPYVLPPDSEQPLREFDAFRFPVTVESVDTSLVEVINEIARVSGIEIMIAPGFEDHLIRLSYVDQPALGVLQDLGAQFGFTPMKQGATTMLIVPARDESGSPTVPVRGIAEQIVTEPQNELNEVDRPEIPAASDDPASESETGDNSDSDTEDKDGE